MLEIMTYEVEQVPALDVRAMDEGQRQELAEAYRDFEGGVEGAQDRIDEIALEAADIDADVKEFQEITMEVTNRRNERGMSTEIMMEEVDTLEKLGTHTFKIGEEAVAEGDKNSDLSEFT